MQSRHVYPCGPKFRIKENHHKGSESLLLFIWMSHFIVTLFTGLLKKYQNILISTVLSCHQVNVNPSPS